MAVRSKNNWPPMSFNPMNLVFHGAIAYNAKTGGKLWGYPGIQLFSFVLDGKEPIPPAPQPAGGAGLPAPPPAP